MAWRDGLQGQALEIVQVDESPLRVVAGPGTGKTFALQRRVMRALEEGMTGEAILVVTFTRVAANDLRENLQKMDVEGCENIDARTLHSFCFRVLTREDVFRALGRVPRPLVSVYKLGWLQYETDPLLSDLDDERYGNKRQRTERLRAFEAAWARRQRDEITPAEDPIDQDFERDLVDWLTFHEAITVGELVPLTLRHFSQNPLDPTLHRYQRVIVDEYQDLNKAEQVLVDKVAENCQLVIVGDADQSIYSFKYANPDGILEFDNRYGHITDKTLSECRRCPTNVVVAANTLIARNRHRVMPQQLEPHEGNTDGTIFHVQWPSMPDEVAGITRYVKHVLATQDAAGNFLYSPSDVLILCPSRDIAYRLRDELTANEVPAHSFYHEEALEDDDAKLAFTLLGLFVNKEDRVHLRYWLGFGGTEWRANQYKNLRQICEQEGKPPWQVLDEVIHANRRIPGVAALVKRYEELNRRILGLYALDSEGVLNELFPEGADWAKAFRDLIEAFREATPDANIQDVYDQLRDYITQPEVPVDADFVRIMSLYKSKGLTSKIVMITSAVDGTIPRYDKTLTPPEAQEHLEEQRRLFYVALTRPKEVLVISHYRRISQNLLYRVGALLNKNLEAYPSNFILEAGRHIPPALTGSGWLNQMGA